MGWHKISNDATASALNVFEKLHHRADTIEAAFEYTISCRRTRAEFEFQKAL